MFDFPADSDAFEVYMYSVSWRVVQGVNIDAEMEVSICYLVKIRVILLVCLLFYEAFVFIHNSC